MHARAQKAKVRGQQIAPYREAFRMFDTKNKGYVTADEAYPILYHELGELLKLMRDDVKQLSNLAEVLYIYIIFAVAST